MPYKDSEKQKEYQQRWKAEHPEKVREYGKESEKRETTKETRKRYQQSDAGKASLKRRQEKYRGTEKSKERFKRYHEQHPELRRENWYKGQYGVTLEEFEAQIVAQNNRCPIGNHPFGTRGKGKTSPCQDHDHETGENRLILCREHNVGLGQFHDSIPELQAAISYLQQYQKVRTGELPCPTLLQSAGKSQERNS
jgi:hypothetical protein